MKASVPWAAHDLGVEHRPQPRPGPHAVLDRVGSVSSCGSDVLYSNHVRIGRFVLEDPLVLGHEASRTVEELGSDVEGLRPVQRLSAEPGVPALTIDPGNISVQDLPEPPDVLLQCSDFPPAIADGVPALDRVGGAVFAGIGGDEVPLPLSVIQERERTLTGTLRYASIWSTALGLVASGRVNLDRLVTGHNGLDQVQEALLAGRRDKQPVKVMVHSKCLSRRQDATRAIRRLCPSDAQAGSKADLRDSAANGPSAYPHSRRSSTPNARA
jgi:threonine dehydrogenase-like Zn-dependent dehydrogenase